VGIGIVAVFRFARPLSKAKLSPNGYMVIVALVSTSAMSSSDSPVKDYYSSVLASTASEDGTNEPFRSRRD